jgi:APA family basic amino acid/polyamine antiporter
MMLSYTLAVIGLFILRWKRPDALRPYRCTGYPWLPAVYLLVAVVWILNTIVKRPSEALGSMIIVIIGVPFYLYWKRDTRRTVGPE